MGHELQAWNYKVQYPSFLFPGTSQYVDEKDKADPIPSSRTLSSINPLTFGKTAREIQDFGPQILILRFWMPFFGPSLGYVSARLRKNGVKVIAVIDNLIPHENRIGDKALTNYFLDKCDAFMVMSDVVQKDLLDLIPSAKFKYHPHPIYDQFGSKLPLQEARTKMKINHKQKVILYFGLIRKYKGLDILIKAFEGLNEEYELIIVGESYEDFNIYQKLIDSNSNKDRIHVINRYVSDDEVPLYFSVADVCVLPYRTATQSGVIAISYHFDLPVIVTDVGGLRKTVEPFNAGLVVDKPKPDLFQQSIIEYFEKEMQITMSNSIQEFKKKYSWDSMALDILDLANKNIKLNE